MLCLDHGWDPWDYVRFAFNLVNDQGQFMIGRDLVDQRVISSYENATKEELDEYSPEDDWNFNEQELYKRAGKDDRLATGFRRGSGTPRATTRSRRPGRKPPSAR